MAETTALTAHPINASSASHDFPSKAAGIAWCIIIGFEAVLIILGNLLTIVLFAMFTKLRKKSLFLIINMAFADILQGALLPLDIYLYVGSYDHQLWAPSSSESLYIFYNISFFAFMLASFISAALISGERVYAVYSPLKHLTLSRWAYRMVIFMAWTLAFLVSMVYTVLILLTSEKLANVFLISCFFILLSFVCGCNISIWRKFKHRSISSQQHNRPSQNRRLTKTLLFVSLVALFSWLPFIFFTYFEDVIFASLEMSIISYIYHSFFVLSVANSFLNPVVYALRIPEYRQVLRVICFRRKAVIKTKHDKRRVEKVETRCGCRSEFRVTSTSL